MTTTTTTTTKRTAIRDLSAACLHSRPINKDWRGDENLFGEGADWQAWTAETCEKCGEAVLLYPGEGNETHDSAVPSASVECDGYVSLFEGPMMNYWYPIGNHLLGDADPEDEALEIKHLPLCIVLVDEVWGLALTGGGTDLTWEIVEAFTSLGYLPPVHFAERLPAICGRGVSPKDQYLMKACRRALVIGIRNLRYGMRKIAQAAEFGERHEAEKAKRARRPKVAMICTNRRCKQRHVRVQIDAAPGAAVHCEVCDHALVVAGKAKAS